MEIYLLFENSESGPEFRKAASSKYKAVEYLETKGEIVYISGISDSGRQDLITKHISTIRDWSIFKDELL